MTRNPDELRAYYQATLRKATEGSSRRIWAAAMLTALDAKQAPAHPPASGATTGKLNQRITA